MISFALSEVSQLHQLFEGSLFGISSYQMLCIIVLLPVVTEIFHNAWFVLLFQCKFRTDRPESACFVGSICPTK